MTETIAVVTTTDREEDATAIAQALVEARLAACVQVLGPVSESYLAWLSKQVENP